MTPGKSGWRDVRPAPASAFAFTASVMAFIVVSRWLSAPKYLYYFDSANFALSLDDFNPAKHQPQPPGYTLFVGLIRLIHFCVESPERVLLIAGLLAACGATVLIGMLASELFGRKAGYLAMALLASNPVFWFGGVTNQIRVFLALSSVGIALLAWRALMRPESAARLYGAFAVLGLASGFRPEAAALLAPLLLWTWWRGGHSLKRLAVSAGLTAATAMPWLAVTIWVVGGPLEYLRILWNYADVQFEGTSAAFGATLPSAWHMFAAAAVWNMLGALAWIWVLPFVRLPKPSPERSRLAAFFALWFLPPFLFSAFIHIGDPDQALASVPALSLLGSGALAAWLDRLGSRRVLALSALMIALHTLVFFKPPTKLAKASSYKAVAAVDRMNNSALESIQAVRGRGPVAIVHFGSSVSPRHLLYYFPDDYVYVLPDSGNGEAQIYHHRQPVPAQPGKSIRVPAGSRGILCLMPWNVKADALPGWDHFGPVFYRKPIPRNGVRIGPFEFISPSS